MALPPSLPPHPGRSIILPLCTPTRRLPMQNHTLALLHMPTQVPVIIGLAGKLRCRQYKKFIIIRNESPSRIITKSLLIQSLNDASVLNDIGNSTPRSFNEMILERDRNGRFVAWLTGEPLLGFWFVAYAFGICPHSRSCNRRKYWAI